MCLRAASGVKAFSCATAAQTVSVRQVQSPTPSSGPRHEVSCSVLGLWGIYTMVRTRIMPFQRDYQQPPGSRLLICRPDLPVHHIACAWLCARTVKREEPPRGVGPQFLLERSQITLRNLEFLFSGEKYAKKPVRYVLQKTTF